MDIIEKDIIELIEAVFESEESDDYYLELSGEERITLTDLKKTLSVTGPNSASITSIQQFISILGISNRAQEVFYIFYDGYTGERTKKLFTYAKNFLDLKIDEPLHWLAKFILEMDDSSFYDYEILFDDVKSLYNLTLRLPESKQRDETWNTIGGIAEMHMDDAKNWAYEKFSPEFFFLDAIYTFLYDLSETNMEFSCLLIC